MTAIWFGSGIDVAGFQVSVTSPATPLEKERKEKVSGERMKGRKEGCERGGEIGAGGEED